MAFNLYKFWLHSPKVMEILILNLNKVTSFQTTYCKNFWEKKAYEGKVLISFDNEEDLSNMFEKHGASMSEFMGYHNWEIVGYDCSALSPLDIRDYGHMLEATYTDDEGNEYMVRHMDVQIARRTDFYKNGKCIIR